MYNKVADEIYALNAKLTRLSRKQRLYQRALAVKEAKFKLEIQSEKDGAGKNKYSNDELRRAAFELRKEADAKYKSARRELEIIERQWFAVLAKIERARTTRDEGMLTRRERLIAHGT